MVVLLNYDCSGVAWEYSHNSGFYELVSGPDYCCETLDQCGCYFSSAMFAGYLFGGFCSAWIGG